MSSENGSFTPRTIPYTLLWDRMPVDISSVFESEKPAGKHGFVTVRGREFVFEDGTKARFWGTNFNAGANFPTHSYSEKVARRLAMAGLNIVRFHQLDAEWATPNIFEFTKGKLPENTLRLDPRSMERLDYLIHCLKQEGIYVYMDFLTYRRFREGDGVANASLLKEAAKPYSLFDRRLMELQKKFCRDFMEHVNPYTGLMNKDDPVFAMAELTNENDMFYWKDYSVEPYRTELLALYRQYCARRGEPPREDVDFEHPDITVIGCFCELENNYYREMTDYLRSVGVRFPLTFSNWSLNAPLVRVAAACEYSDSHAYWWRGNQSGFRNASMAAEPTTIGVPLAFGSLENKPFFVSEWDAPWPNQYRTDATLCLAAIGALQGWNGFTIHTYRYGTNEDEAVTGKLGRSLALGGGYHRGIFDTYNDPAKFGLFYHAALITRRGDVRQAQERMVVDMGENNYDHMTLTAGQVRPLTDAAEIHGVRMAFPGLRGPCDAIDEGARRTDPGESVQENQGELCSDTGQLYRNWKAGFGTIDTPMTKALYGFAGRAGSRELGGVELNVRNDYATVALSSLTADPIEGSRSMLLTAVGLADSSNALYNDDHTALLKEGEPPIMIEVIEADIAIRTHQKALKVWAVDNEGFYTGSIPAVYENGVFRFTIGREFASMYYLIEAQ